MRKGTLSHSFLEFIEEIQDPNYEVEEMEDEDLEDTQDYEDPQEDTFETEPMPEIVPVADNEVDIQPESGSAVTVVTPKGTSVSVTESIAREFVKTRFYESLKRLVNEGAGSSIVFSNADINALYNGDSVNDILMRRAMNPWSSPQNVKNPFGGDINEDDTSDENEDDFFGNDEDTEESDNSQEDNSQEDDSQEDDDSLEDQELETTPISANLSIDANKITFDNIELKDKVEKNPVDDNKDDSQKEEEKEGNEDFEIGSDPVSEALLKAKELRKDATISLNPKDAEKSPLRVKNTNGIKNNTRIKDFEV